MHYSTKHGHEITRRLSVCLSVTLVDHDHIGWKSWKLIARTISPTSSLFVAQRSLSTYSLKNMEKFWGENVHSTPTSITSGWTETSSTESHVILGGGAAAGCLFTFVASRGHVCDITAFLLRNVTDYRHERTSRDYRFTDDGMCAG